jgi:hypothetical protein
MIALARILLRSWMAGKDNRDQRRLPRRGDRISARAADGGRAILRRKAAIFA